MINGYIEYFHENDTRFTCETETIDWRTEYTTKAAMRKYAKDKAREKGCVSVSISFPDNSLEQYKARITWTEY